MTASTYGEHITLAARYASLTLITPPCPRPDLPTMLVLRDDVVVNLAALVRDLAGLTGIDRRPRSVAVLARDPVGALAARLTTLPRLGDRRPPAAVAPLRPPPGPANRASSRPDAWTGLAVETLLARDCIDRRGTPLSDTARWTASATSRSSPTPSTRST